MSLDRLVTKESRHLDVESIRYFGCCDVANKSLNDGRGDSSNSNDVGQGSDDDETTIAGSYANI